MQLLTDLEYWSSILGQSKVASMSTRQQTWAGETKISDGISQQSSSQFIQNKNREDDKYDSKTVTVKFQA